MSEARASVTRIAVLGDGQLGSLAAIALKRAAPRADVVIIGLPPDPAAWCDRIGGALPFGNRLHDRLGISEANIVARASGSHRLITRYIGWGEQTGDGRPPEGMAAYGAAVDATLKTAFARGWGGGPRTDASSAVPGSLGEVLALAGRFCPPDEEAHSPLAELDYAMRWNVPAFHTLLVEAAQKLGICHAVAENCEPQLGHSGLVEALLLPGGERIEADLYVDCSGSGARLWSRMPGARQIDWSNRLPIRQIFVPPPNQPIIALEDRVTLLPFGWIWQAAGRDGLQPLFATAGNLEAAQAAQVLQTQSLDIVPLAPGRAEEPWRGNVVALGDAAARFEPLGPLNLDLAQRQLDLLIELLPGKVIDPLERAEFNRRAGLMADRACDTLDAHYLSASGRGAFPGVEPSATLATALDQFERRGRLPFWEEAPLLGQEFNSLLVALGFERGAGALGRAADPQQAQAAAQAFERKARAALDYAPPYADWLRSAG
ncbi:tryptophan 7-halogenase [Altererythrobacter sp.]|uniref:tryptophan 7-halogenase n=1 Tax=Altererythrobacter sp. TaxID=1872480 RepID=UPI003CFF1601